MRLLVPLPLHSGEPSSVWLRSIDPDVSKMTRMLGRSDCARTARGAAAPPAQMPSATTTRDLPLIIAAVFPSIRRGQGGDVRHGRRAHSVAIRIGANAAPL